MAFRLFMEKLKNKEYQLELSLKNSELMSANEEMEASNEELMATNEHLEESQRELIQREKRIRESEENYRALYNAMIEGVCQHEIVYDSSGQPINYRILDVNPMFEKILNVSKEDVVGKLATEAYKTDEAPYLKTYAEVAQTGKPLQFKVFFPPMEKHFLISVFSPSKGKFATVFEDITSRIESEIRIQKNLEENQELLRELQHRAKNSFNLITSMIDLMEIDTASPEKKSVLNEIRSRVNAISEMYDLLYSSNTVSEVNLDEYISRVAESTHRVSDNIDLEINSDKVTIPVKKAIPVGIITAEIITNSIKHAFINKNNGKINITLKNKNSHVEIQIKDNGIGLPDDFDLLSIDSLGLKLVNSLIEQIEGSMDIKGDNGTRCIFTFPI